MNYIENNNITRTIVDDLYHLNIFTSLVQVKDNSICSFITLFDLWTWILTFICTIIVIIVFHKFINKNNKLNWQYYSVDLWISLVGHPIKILTKREKKLKNDKILMSVWILLSMIISKVFSGVLLSSFVNINIDLAINSFQDLINKPSIEIFYDDYFKEFYQKQGSFETLLLTARIKDENLIPATSTFQNENYLKMRNGQAVILCNTYICQFYRMMNPHLNLVSTDDHYVQSFASITVKKTHPYSKQITKL